MPSTTTDRLFDDRTPAERRFDADDRARAALSSYFAQAPGASPPDEAATVAAALGTLRRLHHAVLAMRYAPRVWPEALAYECGRDTSLVVRLHCSYHPTKEPSAEREAAAARMLDTSLREGRTELVYPLLGRALDHGIRAEGAYCKAFAVHGATSR